MLIELKTTKLTKSKIIQMDYIGIPLNRDVHVLGWVNLNKKKYVIVKNIDNYYRADFLLEIRKEAKGTQIADPNGGWNIPTLTHIYGSTHTGGSFHYVPNTDDSKNLELYEYLVSYKRKIEQAGQIYY